MRKSVAVVARHWLAVVLSVLIGTGVAALAVTAMTPMYTAHTEILVQQTDADGPPTSPGARVIASYAAVLEGGALTGVTAEALDVRGGLADRVEASARGSSDVIDVRVEAESPEAARESATHLVEEFQTWLDDHVGTGAVTTVVVTPAHGSADATSPDWTLALLIGALAGLVIGLVIASARASAPGVLASSEDAKAITDAPVLGTVTQDPDMRSKPLLTQIDSHHPRRESMRILRTNLQFLDIDRPQKVITVTSALPGEGKTTTACNLAIALAETGRSVVLVDGDLRRPRLDGMFGLERTVGLTTALVGRAPLEQAVQSTRTPGLDVLTSGSLPPNPSEILQTEAMIDAVRQLADRYDVVLIDAPPLLPVTDGALLAALSDGALVVARHGRTRLEELQDAAERLKAVGATVLGTVISMTPRRSTSRYGYGTGYGPEFFARETARPTRRGGRRSR